MSEPHKYLVWDVLSFEYHHRFSEFAPARKNLLALSGNDNASNIILRNVLWYEADIR